MASKKFFGCQFEPQKLDLTCRDIALRCEEWMQVIGCSKYAPHRKAMSLQVGWYPSHGSILEEAVDVDFGGDRKCCL